jgi:hypothetical protein
MLLEEAAKKKRNIGTGRADERTKTTFGSSTQPWLVLFL